MKILDCNQIKIFINLEIIGEEDKDIYIYVCVYACVCVCVCSFFKSNKISTIW